VPSLALPGGVANYYRTLRPHLDAGKQYFEIGARPGEAGGWTGLRRMLADSWRFHRELRRGAFDLVHLNPSLGSRAVVRDGLLLLIARLHRRPVLVYFRGWDPACEQAIRARHAGLFRFVYGKAAAFVVLAGEFARSLRELGLGQPVYTETTVVADEVFAAVPAAGRDDGEILYLSRLDRDKGLPEAIDAVAEVSGRRPDVHLTVAGEGPERAPAEARARARALTRITFAGHLDDAARAAAYRRASIFLFPTAFGEGMPNAILEAMAFGLPVVTRPVGGIRDFFEDGRMGFVTESRSPAVFAGFLARLLADPALRAAMGQYNREYARGRFAASVVAARLLEIYDRVAGQGRAR
jgi:glycosyltransferase involved in cell wall biosynthesis